MIIPGVERDDHLPVPPLTQCDPVAVVTVLEQRHHHPRQGVTAAEGVGDAVLASVVDLGDDQDVVEQEHFSLVLA